MARTRASDAATRARSAFGRVGIVQVGDIPADNNVSTDASFSASDNAGVNDGDMTSESASLTAGSPETGNASEYAGRKASTTARPKAGGKAGRAASRKAGRPRRRVGRPRGPERVALTIRILAATDARLTAAVETTGQSPQYIVDAALAAYFDALGIPGA